VCVLLQARAKSAVVVVAGTHIDKVKHFEREKESYVKRIKDLYNNQHYYPPIKAIKFVSCNVKYKKYELIIKELRDALYDIASAMKLSLGKNLNH